VVDFDIVVFILSDFVITGLLVASRHYEDMVMLCDAMILHPWSLGNEGRNEAKAQQRGSHVKKIPLHQTQLLVRGKCLLFG
jgi:hypothetical protein